MSIFDIFGKKKVNQEDTPPGISTKTKIDPVYIVILKANKIPTQSEVGTAIEFFVRAGRLEAPPDNARIVAFYSPNMLTKGMDGKFMAELGSKILELCPDLKPYITVTQEGFESHDLDFNIVGTESKIGYFRVVHVKGM